MQEICEMIRDTEALAKEGKIEEALEVFLDTIDEYRPINEELADEAAFQMGWFLFEQYFYAESIETWRKLQSKGYHSEEISQLMEEAFLVPNTEEFQKIYEENLNKCKEQIHTREICSYGELPYAFIPVADGEYYLYERSSRQIGEKIIVNRKYSDDEILSGENAFDTIIFWKDWDYAEPIKTKQRSRKQMVCFLSNGTLPFAYLQLPEFGKLFENEWHIFGCLEDMQEFFHDHREASLPRLYQGIQGDAELFRKWIEAEHSFRCSPKGKDGRNVLLTIGIPSYNRGHRALENIKHLQKSSYDSEVEFLICDNCSQADVEGYQEIERLAEADSRITYYRFPEHPGGNISFAEVVNRAAGKFCCMLSDEDMIYLDNIWKYLFLIQKYGENLGFIKAAGEGYYRDNTNKYFEKGEKAFWEVFWTLNYLSGCIFSTDAHQELKLNELYGWFTEIGNPNPFAKSYPHNAAAMRCAIEKDIYTCGEMLFQEGKDENIQNIPGEKQMLDFARVDRRLQQLRGVTEFLNEWKNMLSPEVIKNSYMRAVGKVFMLVDLIRRQGRIVECDFQDAHDRILRASIEGIKELKVEVTDREYADIIALFSSWHMEYYEKSIEET